MVRVFGDGYKGSTEENGTEGASGAFVKGVAFFSDRYGG